MCIIITGVFSADMLCAAIGELTHHDAVLISMNALELPVYILTILGVWKVLGVVALWAPVPSHVKEWAYAGFFFTVTGALFTLVLSQAPLFIDGWIFAPLAFVLWLTFFVLYRRSVSFL